MLYSSSGKTSKEARKSFIVYAAFVFSITGEWMEYAFAVWPFIVPMVWMVLPTGTFTGGNSP